MRENQLDFQGGLGFDGGMPAIAIKRNRDQTDAIFARFAQAEPHPKTELTAPNPFAMLVAIVLSAQATDVSVNKATAPLFARYDTPVKLLKLGEAGLTKYIRHVGLYRAKAKNVMGLCRMLIAEYDGQIPRDRDALMLLPGVGRKTANVWLNNIYGEPVIGVDTHVFRVANRIGLCATANPLQTELALEKIIPDRWKTHAHHWLILHGRYVCKARLPECWRCLIEKDCGFKAKVMAPPAASRKKQMSS